MKRCCMCQKKLPETEKWFAWKNEKRGWFQAQCRTCQAAYRKKHYTLNKKKYIEKAARWTRDKKIELYSWLQKQACKDCGNDDFRVLEFDHLLNKTASVSNLMQQGRWHLVWKEVEKCEVVCANCHRLRTAARGNYFAFMSPKC